MKQKDYNLPQPGLLLFIHSNKPLLDLQPNHPTLLINPGHC